MIATHRKVHLFDIDVPGKIRFIASIRSARCIIIRSHCSLRRKAKLCLPEVTLHMSIPVSQKLPLLMPVTLYILNIVGTLCIEYGKIGVGICYDIRYARGIL